MKKVMSYLAVAAFAIAVGFAPSVSAKSVGTVYGDALVIGPISAPLATISTAGAIVATSISTGTTYTAVNAAYTGTLDVDGNSTFGADLYVTTNTAATGAWAFPGAVSIAGAVTGPTSVTATKIVASGAGSVGLYSRTKAQILALTPAAAGQAYYCSDCTAVTVCVSTGTGAGAFTKVDDRTAACD